MLARLKSSALSPTPALGNLLVLRAWQAGGRVEGVCTNSGVLAPGFSLAEAFPLYPGVTLPLLPIPTPCAEGEVESRGAASSCQSCTAAGLSHGSLNPGITPCRPHSRGAGAVGPTVTLSSVVWGHNCHPHPVLRPVEGCRQGCGCPGSTCGWIRSSHGPSHWDHGTGVLHFGRTPPREPRRDSAPV